MFVRRERERERHHPKCVPEVALLGLCLISIDENVETGQFVSGGAVEIVFVYS